MDNVVATLDGDARIQRNYITSEHLGDYFQPGTIVGGNLKQVIYMHNQFFVQIRSSFTHHFSANPAVSYNTPERLPENSSVLLYVGG